MIKKICSSTIMKAIKQLRMTKEQLLLFKKSAEYEKILKLKNFKLTGKSS